MAAESLREQQESLAAWKPALPAQVRNSLGDIDPRITLGERHGSWFLRLEWFAAGMTRIAEIALANPEATPDDSTTVAVVGVRAAATTDERFVNDTLYERRRGLARLQLDELADRLAAAVQRSSSYTDANLISNYQTGTGQTSAG